MNTLTENLKSSMVNEAYDLVSEIPTDIEYGVRSTIESIEGIIEDIEKIAPAKLAKIAHIRPTDPALNDYKSILKFVCGWFYSITAMMGDYEEEADMYLDMAINPMDYRDSLEDNFYGSSCYDDLETVQDGEDGFDMLTVILDNWNAICKAATGKVWDKNLK